MNAFGRAVAATLERAWYAERGREALLVPLLAPLAALYGAAVAARVRRYRDGRSAIEPSALPVVVVGNLTVGGSGKTPLTVHLVEALRARGWTPGVVSRGHGGERHERPRRVRTDDRAAAVGDEPLLIHRRTGAPVCVCTRRARAVAALAASGDCDLVLSDDGLQHLAMARDAEIVVVDGAHGFGNGRLLPAGPLREPPERLFGADLVAVRRDGGPPMPPTGALADVPGTAALDPARLPPAFGFATAEARARAWPDGDWAPLEAWRERRVHAVAGIARPERFFAMLRRHALDVTPHALPDHHALRADELRFGDGRPVLVTSKDAVRLDALGLRPSDAVHEVAVEVRVEATGEALLDALSERLRARAVRLAHGVEPDRGSRSLPDTVV